GIFPSPVPKSRFDIFIWDYFTTGEIYEANKEINLVRKLNANEKRDIENSLNLIAKHITAVSNVELIDGYRRFDPNRGLDYIFNVKIKEPSSQVSIKRFRLVKPLTRAEISGVPFATETATVHIILPVIITNQSETTLTSSFDRLSSFLTNYESNNLARRDEKIRLTILIGYFSENARLFFQPIGSRVEFLKRKFPYADVSFLEAFVRNLHNPTLELVYNNLNLSDNELCLIVNSEVQFDQELLNRVRLNTLPDFQIFCPIPFVNFKFRGNNTVIAAKQYAKISKYSGRFDAQQFFICSFYWSDFKRIWLNFMQISNSRSLRDVLDLFLLYSPKTKILRYAEPSLISDFTIRDCSQKEFDEYEFESCRYSNKANFASKKYYEPMIGL
uniref:Hexosyltransferase n=1 Tax=Romanomermis culicivorax TaxID=13658 RepID=A0A915K9S1_ROMCU